MHKVQGIPRGPELRTHLASVRSDIAQLEAAVEALLQLRERGESTSSRARELYETKERLEAEVTSEVATLHEYAAALELEIARCKRNLLRLETKGSRLRTPRAIDAFVAAVQVQRRQYKSALADRDAVLQVLRQAEAALSASRAGSRHSGGDDSGGQSAKTCAGGVRPDRSLGPRNPQAAPGGELGDLLSIGPLKKQ